MVVYRANLEFPDSRSPQQDLGARRTADKALIDKPVEGAGVGIGNCAERNALAVALFGTQRVDNAAIR